MKPGTPGFNAIRLREAREARGLTAISLSDIIGVSRQAISQYENNSQTPRPEVMEKIANALQLPLAYFRFNDIISKGTIFYRSMSSATKTARIRAENRYSWLRIIEIFLREYIQFPQEKYPDFDMPKDPNRISSEMIEDLAIQTRRFWGLQDNPIANIVLLLENNGTIIARDDLEADTLDAFSDVSSNVRAPYIILGADKAIAVRSRFDAAHEAAHYILHRNIDEVYLTRKSEYQLIEKQAHRFAAAFLLPANTFANDFYSATLDALKNIKPKWGASIAMMIQRSHDLDFISEDQKIKLFINLSKRGWKTKEPLDDVIEVEQPTLLKRAFELIINENMLSRQEILARIPLATADIEKLAGLPLGFFSEQPTEEMPRVSVLKPRQSNNDQDGNSRAEIIQFPLKEGTKKGV